MTHSIEIFLIRCFFHFVQMKYLSHLEKSSNWEYFQRNLFFLFEKQNNENLFSDKFFCSSIDLLGLRRRKRSMKFYFFLKKRSTMKKCCRIRNIHWRKHLVFIISYFLVEKPNDRFSIQYLFETRTGLSPIVLDRKCWSDAHSLCLFGIEYFQRVITITNEIGEESLGKTLEFRLNEVTKSFEQILHLRLCSSKTTTTNDSLFRVMYCDHLHHLFFKSSVRNSSIVIDQSLFCSIGWDCFNICHY